jgi:hypothetical protein
LRPWRQVVFGLQRAFGLAGVRTTIASLWKVDDDATQALMVEFYRNLWEKKLGKLESLRQAQLTMLREYDPKTKRLRGPGAIKQRASHGSRCRRCTRSPFALFAVERLAPRTVLGVCLAPIVRRESMTVIGISLSAATGLDGGVNSSLISPPESEASVLRPSGSLTRHVPTKRSCSRWSCPCRLSRCRRHRGYVPSDSRRPLAAIRQGHSNGECAKR